MLLKFNGENSHKCIVSLCMLAIITISQFAPVVYNASEISSVVISEKAAAPSEKEATDKTSEQSEMLSSSSSELKEENEISSSKASSVEATSQSDVNKVTSKKAIANDSETSKPKEESKTVSAEQIASKSDVSKDTSSTAIIEEKETSNKQVSKQEESESTSISSADKTAKVSKSTKGTADIDNKLMTADISFADSSNAGLYVVNIQNAIEKVGNPITGGETIVMSFTDVDGSSDSCSNVSISPKITGSEEYTTPFMDYDTGNALGTDTINGSEIKFTFSPINDGVQFYNSTAVFAWDIAIDNADGNTDFPCNLNIDMFDNTGTNVFTQTSEVVFNKPVIKSGYIPIDVSLSDNYTKYGNIISIGSSVSNRMQLNSNGYYAANGATDPQGGVIDTGSKRVGQVISLNKSENKYNRLQDIDLSYTLASETKLTSDNFHIFMKQNIDSGNTNRYDMTNVFNDGQVSYDDASNTFHLHLTRDDLDAAEAAAGVTFDNPEIYIYIDVSIDRFLHDSVDNYIYGSASTFDHDSWASEVDALDGFPNEGRGEVTYTDIDGTVDTSSTRLAYQELAEQSGAVVVEVDPEIEDSVSDDDEKEVETNSVDRCGAPTMEYDFNFDLKNQYNFKNTMGTITIELPSEVTFDEDDIEITLNDEAVTLPSNDYFNLTRSGNQIIIEGTPYNAANNTAMYYGKLNVKVPVTVTDFSKSSIVANVNWDIKGDEYAGHVLTTNLVDCSGKIELNKVDEDGNPLAGVKFDIKDSTGAVVQTLTTDSTGYAVSNELPLGDYTVVETEALSGYQLDTTEYPITLDTDGKTVAVNGGKAIVNKKIVPVIEYGNIDLHKVDEDGNPLAGVKFEIKDADGNVVQTLTTDKDGYAKSKQLELGAYTVTETQTLDGYVLSSKIYNVELYLANKTVSVNDGKAIVNKKTQVVTPDVPEYGKIKLKKVDQSGAALKGAEFTIYNESGKAVQKITTDSKGLATSKDLPVGNYTVKETKAPTGYVLSDKKYNASITNDGQVVNLNSGNGIVNKQIHGKLSINKTGYGDKPLSDVEYNIYDKDGNLIETITTDENGNAISKDLPYGDYYVVESKAAEGYAIDDTKYYFSITKDKVIVQYYFKNEMAQGKVELTKHDEFGNPLSGAQFSIYKSDGSYVSTIATNNSGYAISGKLNYGDYYLVETKAPSGYIKSQTKYYFSITADNQIVKANNGNPIINRKVTSKVDSEVNEVSNQQPEVVEPLSNTGQITLIIIIGLTVVMALLIGLKMYFR